MITQSENKPSVLVLFDRKKTANEKMTGYIEISGYYERKRIYIATGCHKQVSAV